MVTVSRAFSNQELRKPIAVVVLGTPEALDSP
jgi:hypothetical protein